MIEEKVIEEYKPTGEKRRQTAAIASTQLHNPKNKNIVL